MAQGKKDHIVIQEELERRILHGLACEWDVALWVLKQDCAAQMRKPLFRIVDMEDRWGFWSGERNEICLSRNLVLRHSWDAVREVLIHEIAHQVAEQVLDCNGDPPHGSKFRKACHMVRANPKASERYEPLDGRVLHDSSANGDRIMVRVKKLMALAQSPNQHEAEAAMAKAHKFIAKYNIDLLSHNQSRDFINIFIGKSRLRHFREDYHLANLLQDFYFVHGIWVSSYVLEKGKMGNVLEISGTMQNVKIASYVHDYVLHFIDSEWNRYNRTRGLNRYRKTDFAVGIIEGFRSKLEKQTQSRVESKRVHGIIRIQDPLLQEHVKYRYPYIRTIGGRAVRRNRDVLNDGKILGRELVISKGITEKGKGRGGLISHKKQR